jgi:hypothetical protein
MTPPSPIAHHRIVSKLSEGMSLAFNANCD